MVYLIFFIFMTLCYSAFFLLPDLRGKVNSNVQLGFVDGPENFFRPQIGGGRPGIGIGHIENDEYNEDFHLRDDRRKIDLQIRQDQALMKARNSIQKEQLNDGNDIVNDGGNIRGGEGEDHAEIKKEIQEDKAKFLKERDELQNEKKEAQRDSARQRAEMESHDYILQSDGEPSSAQATERRNKIREVKDNVIFLMFYSAKLYLNLASACHSCYYCITMAITLTVITIFPVSYCRTTVSSIERLYTCHADFPLLT